MTQEQLAQAAEIGRTFLSRIETGRFSVTLETLGALAMALGTSPANLIEAAA
jgi:transcriptional regulator with XRE-family HTH domain